MLGMKDGDCCVYRAAIENAGAGGTVNSNGLAKACAISVSASRSSTVPASTVTCSSLSSGVGARKVTSTASSPEPTRSSNSFANTPAT